MSYVEREADARLAAMQVRAEAAEARLLLIRKELGAFAEIFPVLAWTYAISRYRIERWQVLARGEEPA